MKNNIEMLKIEYEYYKSHTLALLAATLLICFGVISNIEKLIQNPFALFIFIEAFIIFGLLYFLYHALMRKKLYSLGKLLFN